MLGNLLLLEEKCHMNCSLDIYFIKFLQMFSEAFHDFRVKIHILLSSSFWIGWVKSNYRYRKINCPV